MIKLRESGRIKMSKIFEERIAREDAYDSGYDAGYYIGKRDGYTAAMTDILKYLEPHTNTPGIVIKRHIEEMKEEGYNEREF